MSKTCRDLRDFLWGKFSWTDLCKKLTFCNSVSWCRMLIVETHFMPFHTYSLSMLYSFYSFHENGHLPVTHFLTPNTLMGALSLHFWGHSKDWKIAKVDMLPQRAWPSAKLRLWWANYLATLEKLSVGSIWTVSAALLKAVDEQNTQDWQHLVLVSFI